MDWLMPIRLGWTNGDNGWAPTTFTPERTRPISAFLPPPPDLNWDHLKIREYYIMLAIEELVRLNGDSGDRDMSM